MRIQYRLRHLIERWYPLQHEIERLEACIKLLEASSVRDGLVSRNSSRGLVSARDLSAHHNRFRAAIPARVAEQTLASLICGVAEVAEKDLNRRRTMDFVGERN